MLEVLLGGIITLAVGIVFELLRKPKLELQIEPVWDGDYPPNRPAKSGRTLRLKCTNLPLPWYARYMLRAAALQCHGTITFHHLDGQNVFGRTMPLRWSGSPHPGPLEIIMGEARGTVRGQQWGDAELVIPEHHGALIDMQRISSEVRMDIYPGESCLLDVAVRYDDELDCYGWTTANYYSNPPWRNPDWRLLPERYLVHVTVTSAAEKCSGTFRLVNDQARSAFRLEPTLEGDIVH